jgi:hypothetical protein
LSIPSSLPASTANRFTDLATLTVSWLFEVGVPFEFFEQAFFEDEPLEHSKRGLRPSFIDDNR